MMSNIAPALSPVANGNPFAMLSAADFTGCSQTLAPPGDALRGPLFGGLMAGVGASMADLHMQAYQLSEVELWPTTTTICLPDFEKDYGLPDCCTPLASTLQQRRRAVAAKIAASGGQSVAYYEAVALALGFVVTIVEGTPASFTWTVHVAGTYTPIYFIPGESQAGDDITSYAANAQLECELRQIMPAHTILNFSYGS